VIDAWTITAALAAAASATFAALQLWLSRREANGRAAMLAIGVILDRLHEIWGIDTETVQAEILRCYSEEKELDDEANRYLSFLDAVDVAALAASQRLANPHILREYLKTVVGPTHMVSLQFVEKLQDCCHDSGVYEHLRKFAADTKKERESIRGRLTA